MDERERTILRKARVILVKDLADIAGLCDKLYSYGVLTDNMVSEIQEERSQNGQARKLLDIIPRRGKDAYGFLHQALVETGQQEMADLLKPELAGRSKDLDCEQENLEIPGESHLPSFDPETLKPLDIKVKKCNREEIVRTRGVESIYKLDSKPKGKVLIINITNLEGGIPSRDKHAHDISTTSITMLFKHLNFQVECRTNISSQEFEGCLEKELQSPEIYDCFIMVVLTHGTKDLIFFNDGNPILVQNILERFNADQCPKLKGKPKLFFIHACPAKSKEKVEDSGLVPSTNDGHHLTRADMFLARAVRYDPIICNNGESKGFRFIQAFVHIVKNKAHLDHLSNMITQMNALAEEDGQLVQFSTTLTKKLFFFPE